MQRREVGCVNQLTRRETYNNIYSWVKSYMNSVVVNPIIRQSMPTDADAIEEVRIAAWKIGFRGILPKAILDTLQSQPHHRRQLIDSRQLLNGADLVSVIESKVVGWISGGPTRDSGMNAETTREIYACYVHPDYWRHGLARALMLAALDILERDNAAGTTAWVLARNDRMLRLTSSLGFEPDGAERYFDASGQVPLVRIVRSRLRSSFVAITEPIAP